METSKSDTASINASEGPQSRATSDDRRQPPLTEQWSHIISYQQLVASASIGLVQFWRFPYLTISEGGWSNTLLYLVFTVIFGYPMHYLELAIGTVTQKGVIKCWDISPLGRGIGWAMVLVSAFTAFSLSTLCAYSLGMFVHSFHIFLPWLHCATDTGAKCIEGKVAGGHGHESPPESFFYNDILNMERKGISNGLGKIVWELVVYYLVSWLIIFLIVIKGIYSYSKLVLFTATLVFFVLITCTVAAVMIETPHKYFDTKWEKLKHIETYRMMAEQVLMEHAVAQGTLIMLGSYNLYSGPLNRTCLMSVLVCRLVTLSSMFILCRVQGATDEDFTVLMNPGIPFILWASLTVRLAGNQFWAAVIFFAFFIMSVCTVALLIQTILSAVRGRSADKMKLITAVILCVIFSTIGIATLCTQGGIYILGFLDFWPVSMPRLPIAALTATIITVVYGQKSFCEDVYFSVKEYPNVFLRICWAICPFILIVLFIFGSAMHSPPTIYGNRFPSDVPVVGFVLVGLILLPVLILAILYLIFRWRMRNIVDNGK